MVCSRRYFTIKCCGDHRNCGYREQQDAASYNDGFIHCRFRRDKQHARRKKCIKTFNPNDRQDEDSIGVYPQMTLKMVLKIVCHGVAEFIWGTDVIVQ